MHLFRLFRGMWDWTDARDAELFPWSGRPGVGLRSAKPPFFQTESLGRNFLPQEDRPGGSPVVLLSDGLWRRLGSDRGIVGKSLTLDGSSRTVVGILPRNFWFPSDSQPDLLEPVALPRKPDWGARAIAMLRVIGRTKHGITIERARSDLTVINARVRSLYPAPFVRMSAGMRAEVIPLHQRLVGDMRLPLKILLGAVGLVLLIACANLANLQLERATVRHKELTVRMAIGASRLRVARQLLTESLLLSLIGGVVGLALGVAGIDIVHALAPYQIARPENIRVDYGVLLFTLAVAFLTGILIGLMPAIRGGKVNLDEALKQGTTRTTAADSHRRVRSLLVVSQLTLALN